jgi:hypothetical protein
MPLWFLVKLLSQLSTLVTHNVPVEALSLDVPNGLCPFL